MHKQRAKTDVIVMIDSLSNVQACLEASKDQRSKFIVAISSETTSIGSINCTLEDFDQQYIFLEATSLSPGSAHWVGLEVTCYFKLVKKKALGRKSF